LSVPIARMSSITPSLSSSGMVMGSSDSPMWKRGWRDFSSTVTFQPARASWIAAVLPAGPPPMISTSGVACGAAPDAGPGPGGNAMASAVAEVMRARPARAAILIQRSS